MNKLIQEVIDFLIDNEQYGEDWEKHIDAINKLLTQTKKMKTHEEIAAEKYPIEDFPFKDDAELAEVKRAAYIEGLKESDDFDLQRLYDWLMDDSREPAQTKFTSGHLRNVAREFEFRLKDSEKWVSEYGLTEKGVKNIIRKGKMAIIKPNISEIWPKEFDVETSESEESQAFFNEYAGKKCYVYKWSGDWWIANEDNHCLTENCFTPTT